MYTQVCAANINCFQLSVFPCNFRKANKSSETLVLRKTDEAIDYLKEEHEAKMKLLLMQQQAAESKRRAYDAKYEYYSEKRRKYRIDL